QNRSTKKFLRGKSTGEGDKTGFSTITLNLGKKDRVLPPQIIGLVNQCTSNRKIRVGRIDIGFTSSRVQIESYHADRVSEALCGCRFRGRTLIAEKQNTKQGRTRKTA
ncbi:MAG TPA: DbpA RNA binding domain-containing protein, partial [Spirochaetia bacterium]|nr:DbpA RNA binding domain-containing protein [Spirochaetia bacterium]